MFKKISSFSNSRKQSLLNNFYGTMVERPSGNPSERKKSEETK